MLGETDTDAGAAFIHAVKAFVRCAGVGLAELGLQPGQDKLLAILWTEDGLSQSEILERLPVEPPTLTKMIARLEKQGFLVKKRDPKDARVSRAYLTARGKKAREPVKKVWADVEKRAFASFSAEEKRALHALTLKMLASLRAAYPDVLGR